MYRSKQQLVRSMQLVRRQIETDHPSLPWKAEVQHPKPGETQFACMSVCMLVTSSVQQSPTSSWTRWFGDIEIWFQSAGNCARKYESMLVKMAAIRKKRISRMR